MKKLIFAAAFLLSILSLKQADAQLSISLNLNIDSQPTWGPTGYDHAEYYYMPDIDCYYYVPGKQFVYQSGSKWIKSSSLPAQYRNYDLYNGYKVVVNKPSPYLHDADYRKQYASYKGRRGQAVIRDSHDAKYKRSANNSHPAPVQKADNNHRPATNNHAAPQKSKSDDHHSDDKDKKDDDHGRH